MNQVIKSDIKVSIVIPNYNGEKTIRGCIQSVINNSYKNIEIIVVDDCSEDSSIRIINSFKDSRLKVIKNKINLGPSKTRNKGIKSSKGQIVLLIDSDTYVDKELIQQHVSTHRSMNVDAVAGSIQGVHKTIAGRADDFCNWWTSIPKSKSHIVRKLHVPATNISIKRDVFDQIGYFKEELKYGEDSEFSNRIIKNGLKIYFKSDIIAYHFDRDSLTSFLKHNYQWGTALISNRVTNKMEYGWLLPKSYWTSWIYIAPLAFMFTCFIIYKWVLFKPKILLYSPLLFLGKVAELVGVKDSLHTNKSR